MSGEPDYIIEKQYIYWEGSSDGQMLEHTRIVGIIDKFIKDIPESNLQGRVRNIEITILSGLRNAINRPPANFEPDMEKIKLNDIEALARQYSYPGVDVGSAILASDILGIIGGTGETDGTE